jgi:hypothetical protein
MTRSRRALAAVVAAGALTLTGCGIEERIVHLQPAPTENAEVGAPLRAEAAEQISARVLAQVAEAATTEERQAILVGPALRVAQARAARDTAASTEPADVVVPSAPAVLAVSSGQDWPRAILAATLDEATQVQSLHVLVSTGPTDQFKVYATAPMLPGTSVPGLGEFTDGATFESATKEEAIPASEVFADYAQGITFPRPATVTAVAVDDPYSTSLRRNAQAQADALGELGAVAQTHVPITDSIMSFETADGGVIAFGQMVRTDRVALSDQAKELQIEDETLQELSGKEVVTSDFTAEFLENLIFVAPAGTPAGLIGAEEVVLRAEGS